MRQRLVSLVLLVVLLVLLISPAVALTGYGYYVSVVISNSTAADITGRFVYSINADGLVDGGFMQSDADDARFDTETDVSSLLSTFGALTSTAAYWYTDRVTVPANGSLVKYLWVGNLSATARDQTWVADDGDTGTVADAANLDITTNLTLRAGVYPHSLPVAEKEIISKQGNYELAIDAANYIFRVWLPGAPTTETLSPNAAGDLTNLTSSAGANWSTVDEAPPLGAGADGDYVYTSGTGTVTDTYNLAASAIPEGSSITSATVYFRGLTTGGAGNGNAIVGLRLGASNQDAAAQPLTGVMTNYSAVVTRPGGGNWVYADLANLQVRLGLSEALGGPDQTRLTQLYVEFAYTPPGAASSVTVAATPASMKNVVATYDGANISISDGGAPVTAALVGALHTNAEPLDIAILDGKVDYVRIGDTNVAAPTWRVDFDFEADQITGTGANSTVTDQATGGGDPANNMTSTRAGNPAGISVVVGGVVAASPSTPPLIDTAVLTGDAASRLNPSYSPGLEEIGSGADPTSLPSLLMTDISNATGVSSNWVWWAWYGLSCAILFTLAMVWMGGSIQAGWFLVILCTMLFVRWEVVPWGLLVIYGIFAVGTAAWQNRDRL